MEDVGSPSEQYGSVMDIYEAAAAPSRDAARQLVEALDGFDKEHDSLLKLLNHGDQLWELRQSSEPGSGPFRTASANMGVALREMTEALGRQEAALYALQKRVPRVAKSIEALQTAVEEVASFQTTLRKSLKSRIKSMGKLTGNAETEERPAKAERAKQRSSSPRYR